MSAAVAQVLVTLAAAYVGVGVLFAAAFVTRGAGRIDSRAAGASWGFRVLIIPGSTLLWPWLAARWTRAESTRR